MKKEGTGRKKDVNLRFRGENYCEKNKKIVLVCGSCIFSNRSNGSHGVC